MADSCGVKYVEGFSFHKLGEGFGDITVGWLDKATIALMKTMLNEKHLVCLFQVKLCRLNVHLNSLRHFISFREKHCKWRHL